MKLDELVTFLGKIQDQEDADDFLRLMRKLHPEGWDIAWDVGYATGYLSTEDGQRVRELLGVEHPVIGDIEDPTPDELFLLGARFMEARAAGKNQHQAAEEARAAIRGRRIGMSDLIQESRFDATASDAFKTGVEWATSQGHVVRSEFTPQWFVVEVQTALDTRRTYGVWRNTGNVYVEGPDGAMSDDPIYAPGGGSAR